MILNRRARSAIIAVSVCLLAAVYGPAWLAPSVAMDHESSANLVLAKAMAAGHGYVRDNLPQPVAETQAPPLFPALLALFTLLSSNPWWLKVLPLGCAFGWFALLRFLLLRMSASNESSLLLIGLTAASPAVVFVSTTLVAETLFAMLVTAALLQLLDDHPLAAGALAGLATLTLPVGAPLIVVCIVTFVVRGKFRSAMIFAAVAMLLVAPWFGWSLAHITHGRLFNVSEQVATNVVTGLAPNEKVVVAVRNFVAALGSPVELLTGLSSDYAAGTVALLAILSLWVRRQIVPDLFVGLYGFTVILLVRPPERLMAAILPLILWMGWRAVREVRFREFVAAVVLIIAGLAFWSDAQRMPAVMAAGVFPERMQAPDDWRPMQELFAFIRGKTSSGSVLLANMDGEVFLNTGRKTVRGFTPDGYNLFYTERQSTVSPDQLSTVIARDQVNYVVLMPDRGEAEAVSFRRSVEALERGGVLGPVQMPGVAAGYRVLHVEGAGF